MKESEERESETKWKSERAIEGVRVRDNIEKKRERVSEKKGERESKHGQRIK